MIETGDIQVFLATLIVTIILALFIFYFILYFAGEKELVIPTVFNAEKKRHTLKSKKNKKDDEKKKKKKFTSSETDPTLIPTISDEKPDETNVSKQEKLEKVQKIKEEEKEEYRVEETYTKKKSKGLKGFTSKASHREDDEEVLDPAFTGRHLPKRKEREEAGTKYAKSGKQANDRAKKGNNDSVDYAKVVVPDEQVPVAASQSKRKKKNAKQAVDELIKPIETYQVASSAHKETHEENEFVLKKTKGSRVKKELPLGKSTTVSNAAPLGREVSKPVDVLPRQPVNLNTEKVKESQRTRVPSKSEKTVSSLQTTNKDKANRHRLLSSGSTGSKHGTNEALTPEETRRRLVEAQATADGLRRILEDERQTRPKKKELDDLKAQLASAQKTIDRGTEEHARISTLETRCQILQTEFSRNVTKLETVNREKLALEKRLQEQIKATEVQQTQIAPPPSDTRSKVVEAELAALKQVETRLKAEAQTLRQERDMAVKESSALKQKLTISVAPCPVKEAPPSKSNGAQESDQKRVPDPKGNDNLLKEKETKIHSMEAELNKLNEEIANQRQKNNVLRERNWLLAEELSQASKALEHKAKDEDETERTHHPQVDQLKRRLASMEEDLATATRVQRQLEDRMKQSSSRLTETQEEANQIPVLTRKIAALEADNAALRRDKESLTEVTDKLTQAIERIDKSEKEACSLQQDLMSKQNRIQALELQTRSSNSVNVPEMNGFDSDLTTEVETLRAKNNELREKNWTAVEALSSLEKEVESRIEVSQRDLQTQLTNLRSEVSHLKTQKGASEALRAEVEHYKGVLKDTEGLLSRLQASVDEEEKKWRTALEESERDCELAREELRKVYCQLHRIQGGNEEISDLHFAYNCVEKSLTTIVTEMEKRIQNLEDDLETVSQERDELTEELAKLREELRLATSAQVNGVAEETVEPAAQLSTSSAGHKHHHHHKRTTVITTREIVRVVSVDGDEEVTSQLESQQKVHTDLAIQNTTLSASLKTGEDAVKEEQHLDELTQEQASS